MARHTSARRRPNRRSCPETLTVESVREKDRIPLIRTLVGFAVLPGALGIGRAPPVDRARGSRRGSGGRRRLLPRPPLRAAARVAVPAPGGHRGADEADRDRHGGDRHALREPAVHGRGRRCRRPHRRWSAAARDQPRLARAGHRRLPLLRLRARGRQDRRGHGARPHGGVPARPCPGSGLPSRTPRRCSRIRPDCSASSRIRRACGSGSGGARDPERPPNGRASRG